jgi:lantibiotic biosynthesis protein
MIPPTWHPPSFTDGERDLICKRVRDIGHRLRNAPHVLKISRIAAQQSKYMHEPGYRLRSLGQGPLGVALLYSELDRVLPGEDWDQAADEYLALLQGEIAIEAHHTLGLFSGECGLLFVAHSLSRKEARYRQICSWAEKTILPAVQGYVGELALDDYPLPENYDLMNGAIGIGAALLSLVNEPLASAALASLLNHLTWLGQRDIVYDIHQFDHWYGSVELRTTQARWRAADSAYVGYGMQRGLAGLIALLSLAVLNSSHVSAIPDALKALCAQVRQGMCRDEQGWYWSQVYAGDAYHRSGWCTPFAWCTGTTGIARALWLAGRALGDQELCTLALECIAEAGQRFRRDPTLIGPSLCHGLAGVLLVCLRFARESGEPTLAGDVRAMTDRLLEMFESDRPFGYRAFEPEYIRVDSPWLLEGGSGVALALLATVSPTPPAWDRVMLLG